MQVVPLTDTCEERGLLGVGAVQISTAPVPIERRVGFACKIAKWMMGEFVGLDKMFL